LEADVTDRPTQPAVAQRQTAGLYYCEQFIELGDMTFSCIGHALRTEAMADWARANSGGKIAHQSTSPQAPGDVEVTWWTEVPE
jgi:hypothetical protein